MAKTNDKSKESENIKEYTAIQVFIIEVLKSKWVDNTKVVYIGKATSLKSRLKQYFSFGQGKNIGHYGGRFIWQVKYSKDLIVCWKSLPTDERREFEANLIKLFVSVFGKRPFANLAD